jgi:N-acetylmuramoyl-L-alanine amidase
VQKYWLLFLVLPFFLFGQDCTSGVYKPLVILDAGHGGHNVGARVKNPYLEEKRLTLQCTFETKRILEKLGYHVSLTRSRDFFLSLQRRVEFANKSQSAIFVSIHFNSCPSKEAHGIEIFYPKQEKMDPRILNSKKLAHSILKKMTFRSKGYPRKVKKGNFLVLRETKIPAVLVEGGFMTNEEEKKLLSKQEYIQKLARGIAEGIDRFVKK